MAVRRSRGAIFLLSMILLAACAPGATSSGGGGGGASSARAPTASPEADAVNIVVIGDSIPFAGFCQGCVVFADQFAAKIESDTGLRVDLSNRSRDDGARLEDIDDQVAAESRLRDALAEADFVIVSVGFNNGPPWPSDRPCGGSESQTLLGQIQAVLAYDEACLAPTVATYVDVYDSIYGEIAGLVPPSAELLTLNVYNNWIGHPEIDGAVSDDERTRLISMTTDIFDAWNAMLCDTAADSGFECVDIYHAFNGADGTEAPGDKLQSDYSHPSQVGNDVIADVLEQSVASVDY